MNPSRKIALLSAWVALMAPVVLLTSLPSSVTAQALLGIVAVAIVTVLKPFARHTAARFALIAIASVVVLRYWLWRLTATLPDPALTPSLHRSP